MNNHYSEDLVKPIFQAMIRNVPENMIKKVFFDLGEPAYFKYLPIKLKDDPKFIQECLEQDLIKADELPEEYKNSQFLTKKQYLALLKENPELISSNIYPQDTETVLTALTNSRNNIFDLIEPEFKKNEELLIDAVKNNPNNLYYLDSNTASKLRKNVDVMSRLIQNDPTFFHELPEKEKSESIYLKLMLKNIPQYNEVKEYLSKNKDSEIALMALRLTKKSAPYLHSKFQNIINKCENQKDIYTFLKIQLVNEKNNDLIIEKSAINNPKK